jgi:hypothetical protein
VRQPPMRWSANAESLRNTDSNIYLTDESVLPNFSRIAKALLPNIPDLACRL